jgi:alpha-ketoglutarate-dependent taurine dioxygenase
MVWNENDCVICDNVIILTLANKIYMYSLPHSIITI